MYSPEKKCPWSKVIPPMAHQAMNIPVSAKKACWTHASDCLNRTRWMPHMTYAVKVESDWGVVRPKSPGKLNQPAICPRMSLSPASGAPTVDASDDTNADESVMLNGGESALWSKAFPWQLDECHNLTRLVLHPLGLSRRKSVKSSIFLGA